MTGYTNADRRAWLEEHGAEEMPGVDPNGYLDPQTVAEIDANMRWQDEQG